MKAMRASKTVPLSKTYQKKLRQKAARAERFQQEKQATLAEMKVEGRAGPLNPIIIKRKRDIAAAEAMRATKREYHWTDPIFQDYFKVIGDKSKLLYFCQKPTDPAAVRAGEAMRVELVVQVVLFKDMSICERRDMETICQHLRCDAVRKYKITSNAAQTGGIMKGIGWRAAYESGWDFGTYASSPQTTKTMVRSDASGYSDATGWDAMRVHRIMAQHFHDMAPTFHEKTVQLAQKREVPMLGETAQDWEKRRAKQRDAAASGATVSPQELYSSNITYTYSMPPPL